MPGAAVNDPAGDIRGEKHSLRRTARDRRDAVPADVARIGARAVCHHIQTGLSLPPGVVAGYWPVGSELDIRPLLDHLVGQGRTVALPVAGPRGTALRFFAWDPGRVLVAGRFAIPEPDPQQPEVEPAVVLVPLLAFDRTGQRLGYGAGYYDRTLAGLRASRPVLAVGVAFAIQEIGRVPGDGFDQPLDWIVTEDGAVRCAAGKNQNFREQGGA
jgi:5-formyltetrahydrofolate cyclo-ligase